MDGECVDSETFKFVGEYLFNRSDIERMSDEEFMQYEKDIVKAQREGRIK